ncbi:MAG: hypothetical protein Kapaf2KO_16360 [Candidatus Kapaibacteriales bacterium]
MKSIKAIIPIILTIVAYATSYSQSPCPRAEIKQEASDYFQLNKEMNIDKVLSRIYPKLYDYVEKDMMKEQFESMLNGEEVKARFGDSDVLSVTECASLNDIKYSLIDYKLELFMMFPQNMQGDSTLTPEEIDQRTNYMVDILSAQYGEGNVTYSKTTKEYRILSENEMFAINNSQYGPDWYFLENDPSIINMFPDIIPNPIIARLIELKKEG